jgi:hypothetical protein
LAVRSAYRHRPGRRSVLRLRRRRGARCLDLAARRHGTRSPGDVVSRDIRRRRRRVGGYTARGARQFQGASCSRLPGRAAEPEHARHGASRGAVLPAGPGVRDDCVCTAGGQPPHPALMSWSFPISALQPSYCAIAAYFSSARTARSPAPPRCTRPRTAAPRCAPPDWPSTSSSPPCGSTNAAVPTHREPRPCHGRWPGSPS